jgi:hypothetical protein
MYPFISPCGLSFHHPSVQLPLTLTETVQARSKVSSSNLSLLTEAILFFVRLSKLLAGIERLQG